MKYGVAYTPYVYSESNSNISPQVISCDSKEESVDIYNSFRFKLGVIPFENKEFKDKVNWDYIKENRLYDEP
jgi:hypothetical protein